MNTQTYCEGILEGFRYCLDNHEKVFVMGQGLWSPWYVGRSMDGLDRDYGQERIMDSPVSEDASTAIAAGASLCGYHPVIVHPRVDFMVLATNSIVNQIAKWSHMLGGQAHPAVTIRGIVNRGGEQGAQHSQALHSWYAHVPGLKVVMPATARDARDLLIASILSTDPVLYIDDRWCYDEADEMGPASGVDLNTIEPTCLTHGRDLTIVGSSYSTTIALRAAKQLAADGIDAEVVDLRMVNPLKTDRVAESVRKTGRLLVVDGSWKNCGLAGEVIARVSESVPVGTLKAAPARVTLPDAPAPTSKPLEAVYYPDAETVVSAARKILGGSSETTH